ncbi:MAG: cellulase family glycosylhydrolase [Chloroflexi bacterium]|nr:cellulase family glycosylhydrolase [Chloroflexota bacterium]
MQVDPGTDLPRSLKLLRDAGFDWAKIQVRWERVEPERGDVRWETLDTIVDEATCAGVRVLFSVVSSPRWARPAQTDLSVPGPPADPADLARLMGQMAERYKGRVHAYEVWNEQNLAREWGGAGKPNAAEYVRLLAASHKAIKNADPEATVVAGALTPAGDVDLGQGILARDDRAFLRDMYRAGVGPVSDAIGIHPSGFNNPPDDDPQRSTTSGSEFKGHWSFYYRNFENYRAIMEESGDAAKQLWFTEFGWASGQKAAPEYKYALETSEEQQSQYLVRAFEMAQERGYAGALFLWNLNYAPSADLEDVQGKRVFSILRPDWGQRPAYEALKRLPKR